MKTIVLNSNNVSLYVFEDSEVIAQGETSTAIGDPLSLTICDCNSSNTTVYTGVTKPNDWIGWKYFYTEAEGWVLNPDYQDPSVIPSDPE